MAGRLEQQKLLADQLVGKVIASVEFEHGLRSGFGVSNVGISRVNFTDGSALDIYPTAAGSNDSEPYASPWFVPALKDRLLAVLAP